MDATSPGESSPPKPPSSAPESGSRFARWQIIGLAAALVLMVVGGILMLTAETPEPATAGAMSQNLVPDGTRTGDPSAEGEVPWSEAIFKYGFSFFVGFAMGYAVRSFLKLALIFVGVLAICLFALDYAGFVTVEWEAMDKAFSGLMERVKTQVSGFRSFITGSLPSAGLAATGLYAGFRKRG